MKLAVTGAKGLLGWHCSARIHALVCAASFAGKEPDHELVQIDRNIFQDREKLASALSDVDAVIHYAGVNRGPDCDVETGNPEIASQLVAGCKAAGVRPHIIYANSTHAKSDTIYGKSKRIAGEVLSEFADRYTDLILPHIFGECARPDYNNVTATLIDRIWKECEPEINPEGVVELVHAGDAAQVAINSAIDTRVGVIALSGRKISISELYNKLVYFHRNYTENIFPDVSDDFDLALFNSYRTAGFPSQYPKKLQVSEDHRGKLFESAKGGNSSHTFISTTNPGKLRGEHFHFDLVERFLVVKGDAIVRIRKVLTDDVREYRVSGDMPVAIDQIPLHTHNIENVGNDELVTFFWTHRMFDPAKPDTYFDPV